MHCQTMSPASYTGPDQMIEGQRKYFTLDFFPVADRTLNQEQHPYTAPERLRH